MNVIARTYHLSSYSRGGVRGEVVIKFLTTTSSITYQFDMETWYVATLRFFCVLNVSFSAPQTERKAPPRPGACS
jgi:hypothetical protein